MSAAKGGAKRRGRRRSAAASVSPEYNMLLTATLCLLAFGAVMVFSASSTTQVLSDGDLSNSAYFLKRTLLFGLAGLLLLHFAARRGAVVARVFTAPLLATSFFLLVFVLGAGTAVNGATRWIAFGPIQIQPSEIAKFALILYGVHLMAARPKMVRSLPGMLPYLLVVGFACGLIMLEPDLGTCMVTGFAVGATLIAAGARIRDLILVAIVVGFLVFLLIMFEPYRRDRLIGFLHPNADTAGTGFQALQAKIALGSGGLFGVGLGDGVQKAFYLPEAHTDMIAAVIGEEIGMLGIMGLVALFGLFGYSGYTIAKNARDRYGTLLAAGLTTMIMVQATINLFAVLGMAPLTGVPLPFVSYGNSSLLVSLAAVGLILNVARGGTVAFAKTDGRAERASAPRRKRAQAKRSKAKAAPASGRRAANRRSAGKLRVVEGGRNGGRGRSRASGAKGRNSGGGNRRARGSRHGGSRRASR
jgi:cell division protein FtsW